jgi:WD40 repeat protein
LSTIDVFYKAKTFLSLTDDLLVIGFKNIPEVQIWNWKKKAQVFKFMGHTEGVNALVKFNDNITIASASEDCSIQIWNSTNRVSLTNLTEHSAIEWFYSCRSWSVVGMLVLSNGNLVTCSKTMTIKIWNITSLEMFEISYVQDLEVTSIQLVGVHCLAVGSHDKKIRLWNLTSGENIKTISNDSEVIQCILFLNNSQQLLASGEWDSNINIWNLETTKLVSTLVGHVAPVYALLNLKQDHLASASQDCTIKIWNYQSGQLLQSLRGHSLTISDLILLSDGNLASCSEDKTVKIWILNPIYSYPYRANLIASVDD